MEKTRPPNSGDVPLCLDIEGSNPFHVKLALNAGVVWSGFRWHHPPGEGRPILTQMTLGSLMFTLGLICRVIGGHWGWFVAGMIILTIGEILLFPSGSLFIDGLAPARMRGVAFAPSVSLSARPWAGGCRWAAASEPFSCWRGLSLWGCSSTGP
ncbi:hypothetical protein ACFQ49_15325 [Kroppenstedtia eburnea]|uniref:Uncharacterized protein n=1 Tax=Kroppenstedtia eburnea TaxID=714067 RepID=A0A1N7PYC0_9BACL|nr:hypothetical protein [Kroppenstedtia eburnea]QKI81047.1 MFS transporter [Kroppenstedtia eburnea]SIT15614.1 hypothetical protein SAMN05421790_1166 [Kroppenstedtia eburnea]